MQNMFIAIALITLLLYFSAVYYIGWSGWRWIKPWTSSRKFKYAYAMILALAAASFIIGQIADYKIISMVGAYWMAVLYLLIIIMPLAQITVKLLQFTRLRHESTQTWAALAAVLLLISMMAYGTVQAYSPVVRSYAVAVEVENPGMPIDSLNIAMAADMHFGFLSGHDHAIRMVREINKLKPDLVLFPGDIFDDDIRPYIDQEIGDIIKGIEAPYGVYASLGNHDKHKGTIQELIGLLEQSNVNVLYDEAITIHEAFTLVGRKDRSDSPRAELSTLIEETSTPIILLDHQPYDLDSAEQHGVDVMVSGHTHRGQIFPGNLLTQAIYENDWGYLQKGRMHSIVTSGYGFWGPPIRIGTRSEIVEIKVSFFK